MIVLDIPRAYTAIAEWMACMMYVLLFPPRIPRKWQIITALCGLVIQCVFLVVTDDVPIFLWVPCMVGAYFLMVSQMLVLCTLDVRSACYTCIHGFVLAEFSAALQWQLHFFLWADTHPVWWQKYALLTGVFATVYLISWIISSRLTPPPARLSISNGELFIGVIIGIIVFASSNLSFYDPSSPFSSIYAREIMNIRTLVDFAGNVVLIAYFIQRKQGQAEKEIAALHTTLENQYAQYKMSRESMDLINRKYHDLKHQVAALRIEPDPAIRERWLQEIEADIEHYELQNKTGNTVLDTVIMGKSLYCQKHGIELVVVADGSALSGMSAMDICAVFGNALDNAIECELKIPDKAKRIIRLQLSAQKRFLLLKVENYCPFPVDFQDGLPLTTKSDENNHGFGLKSICNTAMKYGGSMTTSWEDDWFILKMLIRIEN